jgi:DNA-binding IclR family transcriptional regulator
VLLAWKAPKELDSILPEGDSWTGFNPTTMIERGHYMERLEDTRRCGYAVNDGTTDPAIWACAAPIRDYTGAVIATVSSIALRSTMTAARRQRAIGALVDAADSISSRLLATSKTGGRAFPTTPSVM